MSLYVYAPNKVAPIIFTVAYGISMIGHFWQCQYVKSAVLGFRYTFAKFFTFSYYKCWKVLGLQPLCAVLFTAGYAMRVYGAYNYLYSTSNLIVFIMSQIFIYIAPQVKATRDL
jgi:hypothetical protein